MARSTDNPPVHFACLGRRLGPPRHRGHGIGISVNGRRILAVLIVVAVRQQAQLKQAEDEVGVLLLHHIFRVQDPCSKGLAHAELVGERGGRGEEKEAKKGKGRSGCKGLAPAEQVPKGLEWRLH